MKGLDWALYYDTYGNQPLDTHALSERISELLKDWEVQKKQGIIPYVLTGDESKLELRAFPEHMKLAAYERQGHCCAWCHKPFAFEEMQGDHITPWSKGGRTVEENCQMLCADCNRRKGAM